MNDHAGTFAAWQGLAAAVIKCALTDAAQQPAEAATIRAWLTTSPRAAVWLELAAGGEPERWQRLLMDDGFWARTVAGRQQSRQRHREKTLQARRARAARSTPGTPLRQLALGLALCGAASDQVG